MDPRYKRQNAIAIHACCFLVKGAKPIFLTLSLLVSLDKSHVKMMLSDPLYFCSFSQAGSDVFLAMNRVTGSGTTKKVKYTIKEMLER